MKKFLLVFVVFGILGGGGYWYAGIYQPAQYAKAVLALEDELKAYGKEMGQPKFRWRYDYETALNALHRHEAFFTPWFGKIQALRPPLFHQELKEFHEHMLLIGVEFPKGIDRAKKHIALAKNAIELFRVYHPESATLRETMAPDSRPARSSLPSTEPNDLGTAADRWRSQVAAARPYADKMFGGEPLDLEGNAFAELKSLWEGMENAAKTVVPALEQKFGRNRPLRSLPSPAELKKTIPGAAALDTIDEFLSKLENVIIRGNAEQILSSAFNPTRSEALQQRSQKMNETLRTLREQYGK